MSDPPPPGSEHDRLLDVADMFGPFSHEVLNVLNNVVLKAAVLGRLVPADLRPQVDEFRLLGHKASELLGRLQQARQGLAFPRQPVDLSAILHAAISACRSQGVAVEEEIAPHLPRVWGNQADARRLVYWLLRMPLVFAPAGPIRVAALAGPSVVLRVSDPGPPVEVDLLPAFFEPFGQVRPGQNVAERAALSSIARRLNAALRAEPGAMLAELAGAD